MTLEKDIKEIKENISELKDRPLSRDRNWLYTMVFISMIASCGTCGQRNISVTRGQESQYKQLQVQTQNVIGQKAPEKFYEINGQKTYLEIDGKPITQYFGDKK